jgi:hypothetical protein
MLANKFLPHFKQLHDLPAASELLVMPGVENPVNPDKDSLVKTIITGLKVDASFQKDSDAE